MRVRQLILQRAQRPFDQAIARAQLTQRLTADALYFIFQLGVLEAAKDFLDIGDVLVGVEAVALDQHRFFDHYTDFLVQNGIANGLMTSELAEVSGDGVAGVEGKQLALDERH